MARMKQVFDTSVLIRHWRKQCASFPGPPTARDARQWARELIGHYKTDFIVTPVEIEFLAGSRSSDELKLYRVYLGEFTRIDEERIPPPTGGKRGGSRNGCRTIESRDTSAIA